MRLGAEIDRVEEAHPAPRGGSELRLVLALVLCFASQTGCMVCRHARRTILEEPAEYSWKLDRARSLKVYRQWADEAWAAERGGIPDVAEDENYVLGFRDGFVDFVYAGGQGEPPPMPPRQFWNVAWRNPAGQAAAQQWFAGYRHGAQAARNGGYRQMASCRRLTAGMATTRR
jgi:hypothetical protein